MRAHFHGATTQRRRRRRAGHQVCAVRGPLAVTRRQAESSSTLEHVKEQSFIEGGRLLRVRGFAKRVVLRRFAQPSRRSIPLDDVDGLGRRPIFRVVGTAVGWAVLLVSTSVEVCVARERARGPESRRSRELACRALCRAARRCQRCAPRALLLHFACHAFFALCSA